MMVLLKFLDLFTFSHGSNQNQYYNIQGRIQRLKKVGGGGHTYRVGADACIVHSVYEIWNLDLMRVLPRPLEPTITMQNLWSVTCVAVSRSPFPSESTFVFEALPQNCLLGGPDLQDMKQWLCSDVHCVGIAMCAKRAVNFHVSCFLSPEGGWGKHAPPSNPPLLYINMLCWGGVTTIALWCLMVLLWLVAKYELIVCTDMYVDLNYGCCQGD